MDHNTLKLKIYCVNQKSKSLRLLVGEGGGKSLFFSQKLHNECGKERQKNHHFVIL